MININIWKANTTFISKSLLNEVKSIVKNSLTHKITAEEMLFMCNQQLLLKFNIWHRFFFKKIFKGLARHPQISKMLSFATICQALYLRCLWGPWLFLWPCLQNLKFNIRSSLAFLQNNSSENLWRFAGKYLVAGHPGKHSWKFLQLY